MIDSNSIYWPETLPLPLRNPIVSDSFGNEQTLMESGRVRCRRGFDVSQRVWDVQWNFTYDEFLDFKNLFGITLENGSLPIVIEIMGEEREMVFWDSTYMFTRSDNLFNVAAKLEDFVEYPDIDEDVSEGPPFDPLPCSVIGIENGGGDTFDCYYDGVYTTIIPGESGQLVYFLEAGTGLEEVWYVSNSPFAYPLGDTLDDYADGDVTSSMANGTGFVGGWLSGTEGPEIVSTETFDTYTAGASLVGGNDGTGWAGAWAA